MKNLCFIVCFSLSFLACSPSDSSENLPATEERVEIDYPMAHSLQQPVPSNYYDAQPFGENNHLGSDWNAPTGGNTDLGEPFFATGNGIVTKAENIGGGWGNVIIIKHQLSNGDENESLYGHANEILVNEGDIVSKGQTIGTIGNNNGMYYAHLHFEIRKKPSNDVGGGYSTDISNHYNPTTFIKNNP